MKWVVVSISITIRATFDRLTHLTSFMFGKKIYLFDPFIPLEINITQSDPFLGKWVEISTSNSNSKLKH